MVRYLSPSEDPNTVLVWINRSETLPDICCTCGMFTADRVKVKHVAEVVGGTSKAATAWSALNVLLFLFGGPIGWIFAFASGANEDENKPNKQTFKIKVPQCILCRSEINPEVVSDRADKDEFQIWAHPIFEERLQALRASEAEKA